MISVSFDSTKTPLQDLLARADKGALQLPDFQRGWVWDDDRIRFWEFYAARAEVLLQRIEAATGKTIAREPELFRPGAVAEAYDEGPEEWDAEEPLEEAAS